MVDFSLRKARNNWKQLSSPTKSKLPSSPSKFKATSYQHLDKSKEYSQLPEIDVKERQKVGTSMQRRLSVHNPKFIPPKLDYAIPLPLMDLSIDNITSQDSVPTSTQPLFNQDIKFQTKFIDVYDGKSLKDILSNPKFDAKTFVNKKLGDATAIEIDQFTSNLNDLSLEIQDDIKSNINKSYKEVLMVNKKLETASLELRNLRSKMQQLQDVMNQFTTMAEKRLQIENHENRRSSILVPSTNPNGNGIASLSMNSKNKKRDRTSVFMQEKIWSNELNVLFKTVEGVHKYMSPTSGRHILLESGDWLELNAATLKPIQTVHIVILNDMVLIASKHLEKKQHFVVSQCAALRDITINPGTNMIISFYFPNKQHCLYQNKKGTEYQKLMDIIRRAKDDLRDIFQAEEEGAKKIRDSFTYLKSSQQTPVRQESSSPIKSPTRKQSVTITTPNHLQLYQDQLFQNITLSMHTNSISGDTVTLINQLKLLDDHLEGLDFQISRLDFNSSIEKLLNIEITLKKLRSEVNSEEAILLDLLNLKCDHKREAITQKLVHIISSEISDTQKLTECIKGMITLNLPVDALKLYLKNRTHFIQELILQVSINHNPTAYVTQVAVIRFQTLKKVVKQFQSIYGSVQNQYSSVIVNWSNEEVDKHFILMNKQLVNDERLTPQSIKVTRKQIDELKTVGIDFVYKLDNFIKNNSGKIC